MSDDHAVFTEPGPVSRAYRNAGDATTRRYRVTHTTRYTYDDVVSSSYGRCYLTPRDTVGQRVLDDGVDIAPEAADRSSGVDAYGNRDTYFHVRSSHRELVVTGHSVVDVDPPRRSDLTNPGLLAPWESARDDLANDPRAVEFALDLTPPEITPTVSDYAAEIFVPGISLLEAVGNLTSRIYREFTYRSGSTAISTRVETVMRRREGVCQDFARVAIACLRSQGLAARYVSGYLATDPPPGSERIVGADASHAWAAVRVPGGAWLAFDPTNDKLVDERHVTVAWGRDYDDVPPLRGVIYTDAASSKIDVSVDVAPIDPTGNGEFAQRTDENARFVQLSGQKHGADRTGNDPNEIDHSVGHLR